MLFIVSQHLADSGVIYTLDRSYINGQNWKRIRYIYNTTSISTPLEYMSMYLVICDILNCFRKIRFHIGQVDNGRMAVHTSPPSLIDQQIRCTTRTPTAKQVNRVGCGGTRGTWWARGSLNISNGN